MALAGSAVAIPILTAEQFGDVALGGALVSAMLGPSVLAAPFAGAALDRARRPELLVALSGLLTALALASAARAAHLPLALIFVLTIVAGTASPFSYGGLSSFAADVIDGEKRPFAYDALSYNFSSVAGPALIAIITTLVPLSASLALDVLAVTAVAGAVSALLFRLHPRPASETSYWRSITNGLHRIAMHRPLSVITSASTIGQLGQGGLPIAAIALSIERAGSPSEGAAIVTAFAVGSLVGALLETVRASRFRPQLVMMIGFLCTGVFTVAAAADLGSVWTIGAIGASGLFTASSTAALFYLRTLHSPPHLRSQVFAVGSGLRASAQAVGAALAAAMAVIGGVQAIVVIGLMWMLSALAMAFYPRNPEEE